MPNLTTCVKALKPLRVGSKKQTKGSNKEELKAQQKKWADLDGLNTSHWTKTMTWEQMQEDRFTQMNFKKRRDVNGKEKWVKTKGN